MTLDLNFDNIQNNIYTIDLLVFYSENNNIIDIHSSKIDLQDYALTKDVFKQILTEIQYDNYYAKYILHFFIDNDINSIIDNDIDNDNHTYRYKLNTITKIEDITFTNHHFLNTLIIILHKKKHSSNIGTLKNKHIKNTSKKNILKL